MRFISLSYKRTGTFVSLAWSNSNCIPEVMLNPKTQTSSQQSMSSSPISMVRISLSLTYKAVFVPLAFHWTSVNYFFSTINQTALAHDYFYTGDTMPELFANDRLTEEILSFIKDAVESEKRYIIKLKEKRYVDISDDEYKLFCDDISDYIHFKIQQLYNQHSKKDL